MKILDKNVQRKPVSSSEKCVNLRGLKSLPDFPRCCPISNGVALFPTVLPDFQQEFSTNRLSIKCNSMISFMKKKFRIRLNFHSIKKSCPLHQKCLVPIKFHSIFRCWNGFDFSRGPVFRSFCLEPFF